MNPLRLINVKFKIYQSCFISGKFKPAIAHRDFNTRNIMVRPDLTCVICDMGFAMKIARAVYQDEGEMTSLTDVSVNQTKLIF